MTNDEYQDYLVDFANRFPSWGKWLLDRPDTVNVWFDDCFSCFELSDCLSANKALMESQEKFQWEDLPRYVMRAVRSMHEQQSRFDTADEFSKAVREHFDPNMKRALADLVAFQDERRAAGNPITPQERRAFVDDWFEKYDTQDERERTYKCYHCQDTQWISLRDHKGRAYAGPCGYCDAGKSRKEKYQKNGRQISTIGARATEWEYQP